MCSNLHMSRVAFFVIYRSQAKLGSYSNISDARSALHSTANGQYVAKSDGTVMAFMSREGQSWRPISKVPLENRPALQAYLAALTPTDG